jgi:uronate dehydrogenase
MASPTKPVLLTGASGKLGRYLSTALAERGWRLRLTDNAAYPDPVPASAEFTRADLNNRVTMLRLAGNCAAIIHFGALVEYGTFETTLGANLRGTYHMFEAARTERIRVIYASSNHVIGFHERSTALDKDCPYRPDSFYGLSKVFGEMVAQLYWDKHGIESVSLRIGSCYPEPQDERMLATWLSRDDLVNLVERSILAESVECSIIWGVSNNRASWWNNDDRARIEWHPKDSADTWSTKFPKNSDSIANRFQGGQFCAIDYSMVQHRRPAALQRG